MKKYHLYMDESGSFEWSKKNKSAPFILGVLIPEKIHVKLKTALTEGACKYNFSGFLHAADLHKEENFPLFAMYMVKLLAKYRKVIPFVCSYSQDVFKNSTATVYESLVANRYLNMVQGVLEHIMFLHPNLFGQDLTFDFHPNSRVTVVNQHMKEEIQRFENLGFNGFKIGKKEVKVFRVWNDDTLRVSLHRLALEYFSVEKVTGKRDWKKVETIVAAKSTNPLVHWVDVLAWVYGHSYSELKKSHIMIRNRVSLAFAYGPEQHRYRDLLHLYLARDLEHFLPAAIKEIPLCTLDYYRRSLETLVDRSLQSLDAASFKQMESIAAKLDDYISYSKGNWIFVMRVLDRLLEMIAVIPVTGNRDAEEKTDLLFKLYNHKARIHNHRGEDGDALQTYNILFALDYDYTSLARLRAWMEMQNRLAVTCANLFAFDRGNALLETIVKALSDSLQPLNHWIKKPVTDPLLGKIKGTMGQNYAFMAPFEPSCFSRAETLFLEAAAQFDHDDDRLRHTVNLLHLYLDREDDGMVKKYLHILRQTPSYKDFLIQPSANNAERMQYALLADLKCSFYQDDDLPGIISRYSIKSLNKWFGPAVNEHPFELIFAYLGRMAMSLGKPEKAGDYYGLALGIPLSTERQQQPVLQLIRGQVLTWWSLGAFTLGSYKDGIKMKKVVSQLRVISQLPGHESILVLSEDSRATGGWFAPAWEAMQKVDWERDFSQQAAELFLSRFTFNYH